MHVYIALHTTSGIDARAMTDSLATPPHKTLAGWAAAQLRDLIVSGQLAAGSRLYEGELATRMGVSRTPVREAIRRLEQAGLVTLHPNRETVVTQFTADDVREIYQLRAAVEGMAAYIAAERRAPEAAAVVLDVVAGMASALDRDDEPAYFQLDAAFMIRWCVPRTTPACWRSDCASAIRRDAT